MPIHSPNQNHLLAALPAAEFARLAAHLELVPMRLGDMLYEPGQQLQHAYFPTTCIVSMHYVMESGASAESAARTWSAYGAQSVATCRYPPGVSRCASA